MVGFLDEAHGTVVFPAHEATIKSFQKLTEIKLLLKDLINKKGVELLEANLFPGAN